MTDGEEAETDAEFLFRLADELEETLVMRAEVLDADLTKLRGIAERLQKLDETNDEDIPF